MEKISKEVSRNSILAFNNFQNDDLSTILVINYYTDNTKEILEEHNFDNYKDLFIKVNELFNKYSDLYLTKTRIDILYR